MVRWPLQPLQPLQKTQLQPPFGPSVDSLCHPWFTTTNLSYRVPIFWNFRHRLVRYYWCDSIVHVLMKSWTASPGFHNSDAASGSLTQTVKATISSNLVSAVILTWTLKAVMDVFADDWICWKRSSVRTRELSELSSCRTTLPLQMSMQVNVVVIWSQSLCNKS